MVKPSTTIMIRLRHRTSNLFLGGMEDSSRFQIWMMLRNFISSLSDFLVHSKKEQRTYKPGSVPYRSKVSVIYLRLMSPTASIVLPSSSDGPPSLLFAGIHELSTSGMHSTNVTTGLVGSYPTFSPLPAYTGGSFLLHDQTLTDFFSLGSGMPYVARTFLLLRASDKPVHCSGDKDTNFFFSNAE